MSLKFLTFMFYRHLYCTHVLICNKYTKYTNSIHDDDDDDDVDDGGGGDDDDNNDDTIL